MIIDPRRKLTILAGCMTILEDSDYIEDIMLAIQTIIKLEQLTGETYLKFNSILHLRDRS